MSQKKEDAARKAKHRVFPMLGAPEGRNVGSLKRRVRSHLVRWEIKKRTRPWHETDVEVKMSKMSKTPHVRSTFGSWHVQKVHGAVARRLWHEAHVEVKVVKTHRLRLLGLEMLRAPQRRTLFHHLNFPKRSVPGVFCAFWLRSALRATTARTFRHRNFQKWSDVGVLCTFWLGNARCATTACTFSSSQCFATFLPFCAPSSSFFWLSLFWFLSSSLLFSDSSHLCFSSVHIVGSLTSKLPCATNAFSATSATSATSAAATAKATTTTTTTTAAAAATTTPATTTYYY